MHNIHNSIQFAKLLVKLSSIYRVDNKKKIFLGN